MLKTLRIVCAVALFTAFNLFFLGFADCLGALARAQMVPALIALNVAVLALWGVTTVLFGRLYCACVCPLAVMQDAALWVRRRFVKTSFAARPARWYLRGAALAACVVLFLAGGASLAGLLDPYATYGRFASSALEPAAAWLANLVGGALAANGHECMIRQEMVLRGACAFAFAVSVGIAVIACAMWKGRLVCNTVCPVGALLGACAVRPLVQVRIDADACVKCRMCERACRAQCVDVEKGAVDQSRCVRCFECISACRKGAIRWTARKARK